MNNDGSKSVKLLKTLQERENQISKASRVRSLLQKQKGLLKRKDSLTDFKEPVLDLRRINGDIETYERATAGKFVFTHTNGEERFIELRPSDQGMRDYGDKKIRWYQGHENYPFANWGNPVNDNESVTKGYILTKATDRRYEEKIQGLKNKGKLTWLYVIGGIILCIALAIVLIPDSFWDRFGSQAQPVVQSAPPSAGLVLLWIRKKFKRIDRGLKPLYHKK